MLASQHGNRGPPSPGSATPEEHLPYMGEMLLDTRPRRGRKPKKADITHLITKNYGLSGIGDVRTMHDSLPMRHLEHPLHQLHQKLEQHQQQQQQLHQEGTSPEDYTMMEARKHSKITKLLLFTSHSPHSS